MKRTLCLTAIFAVVVAQNDPAPLQARVRLSDPLNDNHVQGNVTFTQLDDQKLRVEGVITGLPQGRYGFHVHQKGDITGGCMSTGSHFNPDHKDHGHPNDENRHVGDMGNIEFNKIGISTLDFVDTVMSLYGPHSIVGRAVVLHEKADDYGLGRHPDSRKTGNAGGRVACGVIGILNPGEVCHNRVGKTLTAPILATTASIVALLNY